MIYEFLSYRKYLGSVLQSRLERNPSYSLRSMAKSLGLAPSTLSDVINNKKNLSARTAEKVASALKLSERQRRYLVALVQYEATENDEVKSLLAESLRILNPKAREYFELTVCQFQLISQWYHYAILEMTFLENFIMSPQNISKALKISAVEAKKSLQLLLKLELIAEYEPNRYLKTQKKLLTQSFRPNQALRQFHAAMLDKARESLETQMPDEKIVGSETLPINSRDLNEANLIIEDCFERLVMLSEKSKDRDHVYHLGIQFFKLTAGK